jgi:uncharacterized protein DUF2252
MGKRAAIDRVLHTFIRDDHDTAASSHGGARRVEGKYQKIRRSPYKLLRATNPTFIYDVEALPEFWRMPAHELAGPLLGDAHPENLGAVGGSAATAQVDCTDFDVVAVGPLARDLARAACGFAVAEDQKLPKDKDDEKALAHALDDAPSEPALARVRLLATTWAERLLAGQGGLPDAAAFAEHLAAVDTPIDQVQLDESTHVVAEHPGTDGIAAALGSYAENTPAVLGARLVKAFLLHGKGASSFCVDRVILRLALAEGGAAGRGERFVEWKPQPDAPTVRQAFVERRNPATFDPFLGLASVGGVGHVAQRWLSDEQKVKSKDLRGPYADDVARLMAVRLADLHRRFSPALVERVRGQPAASIAEALADLVAAYLPVLRDEWRAFLSLPAADLTRRVAA